MPTIKKRGAAAKKQQPEEELRSMARQVSGFAEAHRQNLTVAVVVLAVALVLFAGYRLVRSQQERKAAPAVADALGYYSPAQGFEPDYAKALDLFRDVQNLYPSTMSGAIAQYYVGNCLADLGRYDEALREYQAFTGKYTGDTFLLGLVHERMGYVYGNLGRQAEAVKAFEQSETLIGPGTATMELAKLYESAGNAAAAQQKYKVIADKLAGTAWAMDAMGKVQKITPMQPPAVPKKGK